METVPISLDKSYCKRWGVWQGVRELISNAIDAGEYTITYDEGSIIIETYAGTIPIEYLLMGAGSKSDTSDTIGQFGEGLLLALLVLTREGKTLEIRNGTQIWKPYFKTSTMFNREHLHIDIVDCVGNFDDGSVSIKVSDLTAKELKEVSENYLTEQDYGEHTIVSEGVILEDPKFGGKVFCGGIFVTQNNDLVKGYNFNTDVLKLDRDRETVRSFDIEWITRRMLKEKEHTEDSAREVAAMVHEGKGDTRYMDVDQQPDVIKKACFDIYNDKYKGNILADSYDEVKQLKSQGISNVLYLGNNAFTNIVKTIRRIPSIDLC